MQAADRPRLVMKGAFHHVLEACTSTADGAALGAVARADLERRYEDWTGRIRVLAVAARLIDVKAQYTRDDERERRSWGF